MDTANKQFFIIIGRSGAGKGTQAELLKKYLEDKGHEKVVHTTTGGGFRELIERDNYAARLSKELTNNGVLNPEFLAIWNWSNIFINTLTGNETVILDGAPRRLVEVTALHSALSFFQYHHPIVIYLDAPESESLTRLKERGRVDDQNEEGTKLRMKWFDEDVLPVVDYYSRDPHYRFIHVNGLKSPEEVHQELVEKLSQLG